MAKLNLSGTEQVNDYLKKLEHPLAETAIELRKLIINADSRVSEHIKWNAPAFYYNGEMKAFDPKEYKRDIVVFNLHKQDKILLVFPTGAKLNDATGMLEGSYTDGRRLITITGMEDLSHKKEAINSILLQWLDMVE